MASWSNYAPPSEVNRRAGGRRHYNSVRAFRVAFRRLQVVRLLRTTRGRGFIGKHGVQAQIARKLGVSEATISRDCAYLHRQWLTDRFGKR
jgi:hypothetical protein